MSYMSILPDPVNKIKDSGIQDNAVGTAGAGFASLRLRSNFPTSSNRTNGGRVITRTMATQYWELDIDYNPLERAEFEPVNSFIMSRQGRLNPFYVIMPQYSNPRNSTFAAYAAGNTVLSTGITNGGAVKMTIDGFPDNSVGSPKPGDMFNIVDTFNSNHVKLYMITRCETSLDYDTVQPSTAQRIIHFTPSLTYTVPDNTTVRLVNPQLRGILKSDVQEYSLSVDNLYQYSLNIEEALP